MPGSLSRNSVVLVSADQISADLAGEAAILDLKSGVYYGLDAVGTRIWQLVHEPRTIAEIEAAVLQEYDVEASRCQSDVRALVEALLAEGLVTVTAAR